MAGSSLDEQLLLLIQNSIRKAQTDSCQFRNADMNFEPVVVAGGCFVSQLTLNHRKHCVLFLQTQKWKTQSPEEFTARGFEQIQIARMVDVIAHRTLGVRHSV